MAVTTGRPIKFTPERMEQIRNLLERGLTKEQIAETIGSTVGSLTVMCSKMGISLRKPRADVIPNGANIVTPAKERPVRKSLPAQPMLAVQLEYRGRTRTTELAIDSNDLAFMALEAEIRGLTVPQLMAQILVGVIDKNLFDVVLERTYVQEND